MEFEHYILSNPSTTRDLNLTQSLTLTLTLDLVCPLNVATPSIYYHCSPYPNLTSSSRPTHDGALSSSTHFLALILTLMLTLNPILTLMQTLIYIDWALCSPLNVYLTLPRPHLHSHMSISRSEHVYLYLTSSSYTQRVPLPNLILSHTFAPLPFLVHPCPP